MVGAIEEMTASNREPPRSPRPSRLTIEGGKWRRPRKSLATCNRPHTAPCQVSSNITDVQRGAKRDWIGFLAGSVGGANAVRRQQPAHDGSRQVPGDSPGGLNGSSVSEPGNAASSGGRIAHPKRRSRRTAAGQNARLWQQNGPLRYSPLVHARGIVQRPN